MSQKPVMEINEGDSVIVDVDSDGNGDLGEIVVATTRVETMLGDTAIHPEDKSNGGAEFAGMPRFKTREAVIDALQK
ncbi:hypothetical protein V6N12_027923 [Hibiscus sabdariffa]|uniref:valine--tRNA ligase n=1 Tax=Hibiscus sabdariffa TaxID=183260 RepID=A0ABR2F4A4_9ROSI